MRVINLTQISYFRSDVVYKFKKKKNAYFK